MQVLNHSNHFLTRILIACMIISGLAADLTASPDEWVSQSKASTLTSWNFFQDIAMPEDEALLPGSPVVALSCLPEVNISLGQQGFAVITALTLVNAPEYPANLYSVDIMGPLTNTVYCEQLGQELMVVVTELPTGNSCMSTIYIEDKLRPTLVCTSDTLPCNVDIASIDFEAYIESVTDNCDDDPSLWYSYIIQNLPCNANGFTQQILVTWTATDDSGNSATCQDVIYLRKPSLGQVVFPPNISISCVNANTDPSNTGVPTYNGEPLDHTCQYLVFSTDQVLPMCNGARKIRRTWTVKDWCTSGQMTHVQEILVVDNTPPVITCPVNITLNTDLGFCNKKYTLPTPVVSDACAPTNQIDIDIFVNGFPGIFSPGQMVTLGLGSTLVTMRATDPCGNSAQCMYIVLVRDNTPPVLICPASVTVDCNASTAPSNTGSATAIDICDNTPTVTYSDVTTATQNCALGYIVTRTWRATDDSGNTITCMQMITLTDNTPPSIVCPPNTSIECTASTLPANTGSATSTDSCDNSPTVTFSDVTAGAGCPQAYTISRTWRATDDCGNSKTCVQTILVDDTVPPVITCPQDMTIECSESIDPVNSGFATATDACDPSPDVTYSDIIVPSGPQTFTINRTWTTTDGCDNSSTCLQHILVRDETPPVIICPSNITIQCTASTLPANTGSATATDNCDTNPIVDYSDVTVAGACPQERTITRTWIATDDCGNTATCVQVIVVDDSIAPVIVCPANVTIACTANTLPANTGTATATDNCDGAPLINYSDVTIAGNCPQERTITRTWTATDDCGNSSSCVQTIVVDDNIAPAITCPANVTIACTANTLPANTGTATATDNCDNSPTIGFSDATTGGACPQEIIITRTWTATDDCGNATTCVQTIVTDDSLAPVISCPANITIQCTASTLPANTGTATATDNCDTEPDLTFTDIVTGGGCPQELTITRTWRATDGCGNSSTCVQSIVVDDSVAPSISCPANVTIQCGSVTLPANTGTATATDNCDASPLVNFTDITASGACPQEFTITRTWRATDDCGNSSTCVQTIFIDDSVAPVISCPANITIACNASTAPTNTGTATATDNCDGTPAVNFTDVTTGGACPQEFTITRTWSATDDCGNTGTCVQTIVIDDSVAPVITCPANVTINCTDSTLPANTGTATASDLCDVSPLVTFSDVTAAGGCAVEVFITRTWVATDDCGNSSTCVQTISLQDLVPPSIVCPANITIECTASTLPANTGTATATDNCDSAPDVAFSDVTVGGSCPQSLTITRTWTATDACGNSTACIQVILVDDNIAPVITCPLNVTIQCGDSTSPVNTGTATADDICDPTPEVTFADVTAEGGCSQEFSISRTWTATDACGNTSACIQTILVEDTQAPVVTCPANITIACNASTAPANTGTATATDNCDGTPTVNFTDVTTGGACPQEFTITRTWSATDDCGNTGTCVQTIVIDDSVAPVITCPANVTINCTDSTLPANTGTATASDLCDVSPLVTFSDVTAAGGCAVEEFITRTWVATDDCGNSSTCVQTISLQDLVPPSIVCPANITIECTASTLPANTGTATATDNCDTSPDVAFSDVTVGGSCPQASTITRTWTATDACGNSTACIQVILVDDNTAPVITCPVNVTIQCGDSTSPVNTGTATANDICDPSPEVTFADVTVGGGGGCPEEFSIARTWTATDACGNTSTCIQNIFVDDTQAPAITCPPNLSISCNDSTAPANTGTATATDSCDETPTVDFSDVTTGAGCPDGLLITRTWVATDDCGNSSTCVQTITVDDTAGPLISCPANITIECTASTMPAATGMATATDDCDVSPTLGFLDATVGTACPQEFTINRTWTATDNCGNTSTCVQAIQIEDTTAPICETNNITVSLNGNGMVIITGAQIDGGSSDNCGTVTLGVAPNLFDCDNLGENVVVLTVSDCAGNSSTCTALVTVNDDSGLEAICQNVTIFLDANGNAFVDPAQVNNGSGGGCNTGMLEFDLSQTNFTCANIGQNIVVLTVTDETGATATCTAIITVVDNMPPVITCPANVTVDCHIVTDPNNTGQFGNATATDNCPGTTITETHVINLSDCNVGTIVRTFVATDASGNTASCVQTVTVSNPNPLDEGDIDWPASPVNVNICNSTAPANIPNGVPVIDPIALLCANPDISFVDQVQTIIDNNPATPCRIITRTWTIVDDCQPNGTFVFVQTINVIDAVPPVFTNINDMTKVANANCVAPFTLIASATDCAGVSITNNSPYGANTGANASGNYPIGVTVVIFTATDGCGNIATMDVVITVTDPDPTEFQCEKTLIFLPFESEITVPADTFVTFIEGNCTTGDDFIVSFSGTNPFDTLRTYDCGDVGVSTFSLWLWNEAGTMIVDSCNTADLDLRDPNDYCNDGLIVFGTVENEDGLDVIGVEVGITNAQMIPDTTDQKGQYLIEGLAEGTGYSVAPYDDEGHREGVSTLDLVLIQKHLLGKAKLSSPYKIIAADANKSGHLTALDLLEIRKLILGITTRFQNNTSWRFVDRQHSFTDPYNPFSPGFPESIWIDSVSEGVDTANFIGIKVGDVNGSYFTNRSSGAVIKPRTDGTYGLTIWSVKNEEAGITQWNIAALPGQGNIDGIQFSFFVGSLTPAEVNLISSEILTADQWYYNPENRMITISWASAVDEDLSDRVLLSVPVPGIPVEVAQLYNGLLDPEAYRVDETETNIMKVKLTSKAKEEVVVNDYHLYQNVPNPFSESTLIKYSLPKEEMVTMVIHDLAGRKVYVREVLGNAGMNEMVIYNRDIGTTGMYYYTLYTVNASFTHKMSFTND